MADGSLSGIYAYERQTEDGGKRDSLRAVIPLVGDGAAFGDMHILTVGEWAGHAKGPVSFTEQDIDAMIGRFEGGAATGQVNPLVVDYEHDSIAYDLVGPKTRAAGWIQQLEKRVGPQGAELWAKVEWTPAATQMIRQGEYRYCSAVIDRGSPDRRTGEPVPVELFNVGLTNTPFLDGQQPIRLSRTPHNYPPLPQPMPMAAPPVPPQQPLPPQPGAPVQPMPMATPQPPAPAQGQPMQPGATPADNAQYAMVINWLDGMAKATGSTPAAVVSALPEMSEQIADLLNKQLDRDGMPSEVNDMEPKDKGPETPAAAPAVEDKDGKFAALENKAKDNAIALMSKRLDDLQAYVDKDKADKQAAHTKAIEKHVDAMIEDGRILDGERDDAIWAFSNDWDRGERIYGARTPAVRKGTQVSPNVRTQQSRTVDPDKATEADLLPDEHAVLTQVMAAGLSKEAAVKFVVKKRERHAELKRRFGVAEA